VKRLDNNVFQSSGSTVQDRTPRLECDENENDCSIGSDYLLRDTKRYTKPPQPQPSCAS
jgi:hypothetical protein